MRQQQFALRGINGYLVALCCYHPLEHVGLLPAHSAAAAVTHSLLACSGLRRWRGHQLDAWSSAR